MDPVMAPIFIAWEMLGPVGTAVVAAGVFVWLVLVVVALRRGPVSGGCWPTVLLGLIGAVGVAAATMSSGAYPAGMDDGRPPRPAAEWRQSLLDQPDRHCQ